MNYTQNRKRRSPLPLILFVVILLLGLAMLFAFSLNRMRDGEGGFLSNLWAQAPKSESDETFALGTANLPIPAHVKTIMLLGSDFTPGGGYRTDVLLLAAFNLKTGKVNLFSFPRDLWVTIPGFQDQRINTAHPVGGNEMLGDTLEYNFGFRPDHYAMISFDGFKELISSLGGIDVEVTQRMEDVCGEADSQWCVVEPGTVSMDSSTALWYVRARKNSSDFDRNRRAQEVIQAMVRKAIRPAQLTKLPQLFTLLNQTIETDMKANDMVLYAFPLTKFLQSDLVSSYTITPNEASSYITDEGAMVLLPDIAAISAILQQVFWISE